MNRRKVTAASAASRRTFLQGMGAAGLLSGLTTLPGTSMASTAKAAPKSTTLTLPHAEIGYMSAAELAAAYRSGALSPVEVLNKLYERMAALNPHFTAFIPSDTSVPLQEARASEARWRRNEPLGPLDGVPISVKDHINVRGLITTQARPPASLNKVATADDPVVECLKAGGALVFAKTTSPESAISHSGVSSLHGLIRNPWNPAKTSGGSSSGAGVAAASGVGPIHIGSDGGGSIRGPSAYNGVFGLKSSSFRVAQPNYWNGWSNFGPLARTPQDAACVMPLLTRANARAPEQKAIAWREAPLMRAVAELKQARIGFCPWVGDIAPRMQTEQRQAAEKVVTLLGACGANVETVEPFVPEGFWESAIYGRVVVPMLRGVSKSMPQAEQRALSPWHQAMLNASGAISEAQTAAADQRFLQIREQLVNPLERYDFLVVQQFCGATQNADEPWPDYAAVDRRIAFAYDYVLPLWIINYMGPPAMSLPAALSSQGLPIGVQIVAKHGNEEGLLRVATLLADELDRSRPWPMRWNGVSRS